MQDLPRLPRLIALALSPLPLAPVSQVLSLLTRRMVQHHPGLLRRLGEHGVKRFVLDATDLPVVLLLDLSGTATGKPPIINVYRRGAPSLPQADCRIAGVLSAFLGMMHGSHDGDALFFSRDLVIEGDTSAALALRNAIDDAELDLADEIARLVGPLNGPLRAMIMGAERVSGVALHRMDRPVEDYQ